MQKSPQPFMPHRAGLRAPRSALHSGLWAGCRVGILGGSFNPAHAGHVAITLEALKRLQLDAVWWLVSPQNPLKPNAAAPLLQRMRGAALLMRHPRVCITDLEVQLNTRYTADTLRVLRQRFSRTQFIWLMGADNLVQINRWQRWVEIFRHVPLAVLRRAPHQTQHARAKAALRFVRFRRPAREGKILAQTKNPQWLISLNAYHPESSTAIRQAEQRSIASGG